MYQPIPERTLAAMLDYSGRLAAALTVHAIAAVVVEDGRGAVGASQAAVALLDAEGRGLRVLAESAAEGEAAVRTDGMAEAAESGAAVCGTSGLVWVSLPLVADDRVIGAARFEFAGIAQLESRDRALVALIARQAADALQRARLHAAEREAREEAEAASQMKDEFLATLSHELRTPLNAILGWAHLLRHGSLDAPTTTRALDAIVRNAQAQCQLVGDILDVSRIITGRLRLDLRPVDLQVAVHLALEAIAPAAAARNVRLQSAPLCGETMVAGDPDRLQQVVWNLLSNAVKFTPPGGLVEVRLDPTPDGIDLVVTDTGAGIAPDFLPRVFDRFSQADASTRRAHGGLGLGLAIVRHLVELHGGSVEAFSDGPGRGARFTVRLPVGQAYSPV